MASRKGKAPHRAKTTPGWMDAFDIQYFLRTKANDPAEAVPGFEFLESCPTAIRAKFQVRLIAVAEAPPHRFAGGGYWEAMHGNMAGIYELRVDGPPSRTHYRLFCVLDRANVGQPQPVLAILTGMSKPFRTEFSDRQYAKVRALRDEYFADNPRSFC